MRKLSALMLVMALTAAAVFAQTDEYKKGEVFIGYSNGQLDQGVDSADLGGIFPTEVFDSFHGFNVSGVYNVSRFIGIKGDVSGTYNSTNFQQTFNINNTPVSVGLDTNTSLYNFLGGIQVKDNRKSGRFKPFGHAMVGVARVRSKLENFTCAPADLCGPQFGTPDVTITESGLALAFGGGIDIRLNDRVQIRAIQFDYNPIRGNDGPPSHNARIGFGIVF